MPKTLECVWRTINNTVIELTDEQWEAVQNEELYYFYATRTEAYFEDNEGNQIEIPIKSFYAEPDESGREGLFCPDVEEYVG